MIVFETNSLQIQHIKPILILISKKVLVWLCHAV